MRLTTVYGAFLNRFQRKIIGGSWYLIGNCRKVRLRKKNVNRIINTLILSKHILTTYIIKMAKLTGEERICL